LDAILAFGRAVLLFLSFFIFALASAKMKNKKMGKYHAAAGK